MVGSMVWTPWIDQAEALAPRKKAVRTARSWGGAAASYGPPTWTRAGGAGSCARCRCGGGAGGLRGGSDGRRLAHARERLADGWILRPRARFVG